MTVKRVLFTVLCIVFISGCALQTAQENQQPAEPSKLESILVQPEYVSLTQFASGQHTKSRLLLTIYGTALNEKKVPVTTGFFTYWSNQLGVGGLFTDEQRCYDEAEMFCKAEALLQRACVLGSKVWLRGKFKNEPCSASCLELGGGMKQFEIKSMELLGYEFKF